MGILDQPLRTFFPDHPTPDEWEKKKFVAILGAVQDGFNVWAAKPHNKKWFHRIDGTPIPNDVAVCIAEEVARMLQEKS